MQFVSVDCYDTAFGKLALDLLRGFNNILILWFDRPMYFMVCNSDVKVLDSIPGSAVEYIETLSEPSIYLDVGLPTGEHHKYRGRRFPLMWPLMF